MHGRTIFYCIHTKQGTTPAVEELRPVSMAGKKVTLNIRGELMDIEPSDMYQRPDDVTDGFMVGINEEKLTTMWNKAVKRQAIQALNSLNRFLIIKEQPEEIPSESKPVPEQAAHEQEPPTPNTQLSSSESSELKEEPKPKEESTLSSEEFARKQEETHGESAIAQTPTVSSEEFFAHAVDLDIEYMDELMVDWVSKTFPAESNAYANIVRGMYATPGWMLVLDGLSAIDRDTMAAFLTHYDKEHDIDLTNEWKEGSPNADNWSIALTTAICNRLMGEEILPSLDPPFCYGVDSAIYTGKSITFISPRPML